MALTEIVNGRSKAWILKQLNTKANPFNQDYVAFSPSQANDALEDLGYSGDIWSFLGDHEHLMREFVSGTNKYQINSSALQSELDGERDPKLYLNYQLALNPVMRTFTDRTDYIQILRELGEKKTRKQLDSYFTKLDHPSLIWFIRDLTMYNPRIITSNGSIGFKNQGLQVTGDSFTLSNQPYTTENLNGRFSVGQLISHNGYQGYIWSLGTTCEEHWAHLYHAHPRIAAAYPEDERPELFLTHRIEIPKLNETAPDLIGSMKHYGEKEFKFSIPITSVQWGTFGTWAR